MSSHIFSRASYTIDGVVGQEFYNAIGIYLAIWDLITFIFFLCALRTIAPIVVTLGLISSSITIS
ncbi:uncharacterized protein F5891DRAFT_1034228 [Suillus fuscotomentosus]|uniref:Uncharacterized protein n=1 Tax=Suillus fuscotomentosus TaxID=1912939 RepID=A0AAD4HL32_9AGAM|nr:uncharacterized protein F5891DRAFT_1034228 [Suillus fuscotomentosus]KAG1900462.1 hypothetical protein F5891DRAFT_1034228 [Suillus fuscotomentosus]